MIAGASAAFLQIAMRGLPQKGCAVSVWAMDVVGDRVRKARIRMDLTQRELAVQLEWGEAHVSRLELGGVRDPKGSTIVRLARALGVSTDYLLGLSDDPRPAK